ncbi:MULTISPECIES: type II toxin-antitoxin system Rv0910 family toxin [unclassified Rhodococcus (in: high G+C Gram-positive bacteria)]|uniref:type II toxin-antitoxin system Rv0910 family toxin n=1 Tax=unclassified Rhodococcus (in: high G+C Gram-positive bacteria) TaxID=192944 RepID=UPI0006FA7920|nr:MULTISPECIES: SRPBCC family protein [unclassified Rhodococcus (in: high G+C Gram-positive bacteria)]KQU39315.1 toxin [Rhodococcus sp. Leaf225]KQU43751.1 toxin [Rhodococcus sp. Leaf258]MBY6683684.1 SRPBCC family protein [Rhodococcus sp. BP-316]MBY6684493.1 SRPBCC family protein [Rhodococcus sp. BP-288]MBY6696474.1 SRPBCC family protein [Rhodococcus sp. BP-188]
MAKLEVVRIVPLSAEDAWNGASDLTRYEEWLSIHDGWRSDLPAELSEGTQMASVVSVKGMRNRVQWTVKKYSPPRELELKGAGKGGVKVSLKLTVAEKKDGSELKMTIDLGGAPLFGPVGSGVARALKGDIEKSVDTFVTVFS